MMKCAIAGAPGGGKSTLFVQLVAELGRREDVAVRAASEAQDPGRGGGDDGSRSGRGTMASARVLGGRGRSTGSDWIIYDTPGLSDCILTSPAQRK
ncbi:MAG: hypothetical protein R6U70_01455 [Bacillota bacterium]